MLEPGPLQRSAERSPASGDSDLLNIEAVVDGFADNRLRAFPIEFDGRKYWVKRIRKNLPNPIGRMLHGLNRLVSGKDRDALAAHEIQSLDKLRRSGFLTPEVVFRNAHYFVLSDIGPSLETVLTLASREERFDVIRKAAQTLRELHDAGRWHGASRTHNMTLQDGRIGFLDLENTVENWMPLLMRQGWDLYQLGQSAAFFEPHVPLAETVMRTYGPGRVRKLLYAAAVSLFGPYVALYPLRNVGKREIRQGHACIRAVYRAPRREHHIV